MGNPEDPEERPAEEARQAGPVPQGPTPEEAPPSGDPASSGSPPTGHPPDSSAADAPHPVEAEGSADADSAPADSGDAPAEAESVDDDKPLRAAERALIKRYEKERDDFREQYQRTRAEFENYRKRMLKQQSETVERAAEGLVEKLLPILDNFDAAVAHGTGYEQVRAAFLVILEKEGLERIDPAGKPFDPSESDAVAHEDGDGGPVVAEVLRPGYRWKGRVVRPAMVRVKG